MRVRGQYVVSGELGWLPCPDDDLFVIFEAGYRQRSDSRAIKLLDELQRRSSPYPKPGDPSLVVVRFQRADVVFRGRLEPNPEYQPSPPEGAETNDSPVDAMVQLHVDRSESAAYPHRFRVERVERARRISKSTPW